MPELRDCNEVPMKDR